MLLEIKSLTFIFVSEKLSFTMSFGFNEQQTLKYPYAVYCAIAVHELGADTVNGGSAKNYFNITRECIDAIRIASTPFTIYHFSLGMYFLPRNAAEELIKGILKIIVILFRVVCKRNRKRYNHESREKGISRQD